MKKFLTFLGVIASFVLITKANAQTVTYVLCYNSTSKAITVESSCSSGKKQLSGTNLTSLIGGGNLNYNKCYARAGTASGAPSNGVVGVAVACTGTDVLANETFVADSSAGAKPSLRSKTLIFSKKSTAPNGAQYEFQGTPNTFYSIAISALCCPLS